VTILKFADQRVLVVGLGRSGLAAVELLAAQGARVLATDLKPLAELPEAAPVLARLGVEFRLQSPDVFAAAEIIVISPGVPAGLEPLQQARRRGVPVIGEIELAGQFLQGKNIGITGSNGKTTTTALVGHLLRSAGIPAQVGGNIGPAACGFVAASRPDQWNVLELSSFQLETIERFRAAIGVALNVTPDHLDRHHDFVTYAAAKARLFETQTEADYAVLSADDPTCVAYSRRARARVHWFSLRGEVSPGMYLAGDRLFSEGEPFLEAHQVPLRGRHNIENALAAACAARLAGASLADIAAAVVTFPGVEHRLEFVARLRGVDFYNDSKATNVDATLKALDAFDGGLWVILGGKDKGAPYTPLREPLRAKARAALLVGAAAPILAAQLQGSVPLIDCGVLEEAVRSAFQQAAPGDTVLLAPACASFDQFLNFEHRGQVFKQLVAELEARS
jgi:UDP-N-acetylmuramoylalanine--D-glutamate ligase